MAGYSGTPLPQKLGIKPMARIALIDAPKAFPSLLGKLPPGVKVATTVRGDAPLDVIVFFVTKRAQLERRFATIARRLDPRGGLWVSWPKRASGVATDVSETAVRNTMLAAGLVDNKVCAIDETWSGLRGVVRVENRGEARSPP